MGPVSAAGMLIWTRGGAGPNQLRMIVATSGYGTDVVAVNRDWGTMPDNTTTYKIVQGILFDISPNAVTAVTRCFWTAAADVPAGSGRYFYEKVFVVNNNTATALTGAQIEIASEAPTLPSGALLDIGLCTSLNDTNTANPRQQSSGFLPTGVSSFTTQPAFVNVPWPGNLPSGTVPNPAGAQGVWMRLTLPAGHSGLQGIGDTADPRDHHLGSGGAIAPRNPYCSRSGKLSEPIQNRPDRHNAGCTGTDPVSLRRKRPVHGAQCGRRERGAQFRPARPAHRHSMTGWP